MHTFQYQVLTRVDEFRLASGITAPEDKHQVFLILAERLDSCICELLPALALMARCLMGTNGKDCVFTCYQDLKDLGDGHTIPNCCLCALERAYREGKSKFKKPISCALYPIRAKDFGNKVYGINYNKWRICKDAIKKGEELNLPVYKFLEGPLVEKFGKEWYDELCEVAEQVLAELED